MSRRNWRRGGNDKKENENNQARVFYHDNEKDIHNNNVDNKYNDRLFDFSVMIAMIFVITTLLHQYK